MVDFTKTAAPAFLAATMLFNPAGVPTAEAQFSAQGRSATASSSAARVPPGSDNLAARTDPAAMVAVGNHVFIEARRDGKTAWFQYEGSKQDVAAGRVEASQFYNLSDNPADRQRFVEAYERAGGDKGQAERLVVEANAGGWTASDRTATKASAESENESRYPTPNDFSTEKDFFNKLKKDFDMPVLDRAHRAYFTDRDRKVGYEFVLAPNNKDVVRINEYDLSQEANNKRFADAAVRSAQLDARGGGNNGRGVLQQVNQDLYALNRATYITNSTINGLRSLFRGLGNLFGG